MARKKLPQISHGSKYGLWTALSPSEPRRYISTSGYVSSDPVWLCRCDCGEERKVIASSLTSGRTRSCGCAKNKRNTKHSMHGTTEYVIWSGMIERCHNKNNKRFKDYGAKGISVCDEWKCSFEAFYADMGSRPSKEHSIDRIDGSKGYNKQNCRWATAVEQNLNRANNHLIPFNGEMLPYTQVARIVGIKPSTLEKRLRLGWSPERAITEPVKK